MPPPYRTNISTRHPIEFAQTISWMPDPPSYVFPQMLLFYHGIDVNYQPLPYNSNPSLSSDRISDRSGVSNANVFHGIPTDDTEWQRLDLWSITTGNNDEYDYILSDPSVYEVLRHGFKIKKKGFYRVTCELGLDIFINEPGTRYNIAIQFAKKKPGLSATFTRVGVPSLSGYMNYHGNSGVEALKSMHISAIFEFDPEDEIAIFTTRIGEFGRVHAIKKLCMLRIESLN